MLDRLTGRSVPAAPMPSRPAAAARTCYGHLAGRLGVDLYRALRDRDAVRDLPDGTVELGNDRDETFAKLGVDAGALETKRRRFAFECLDTTEHAPHLAGVLGDAVAASLLRRRWITRGEGRGIVVTPKGRRELRRVLALDV